MIVMCSTGSVSIWGVGLPPGIDKNSKLFGDVYTRCIVAIGLRAVVDRMGAAEAWIEYVEIQFNPI
jgi:hypothetical protein